MILKTCPFCGGDVEIEDSGSCLDITCCCSMGLQKSDYLSIDERLKVSSDGRYPEDIEEKLREILAGFWNDRKGR